MRYLAFILLFGCSIHVSAQEVLTLNHAIDLALIHNPTLKAQQLDKVVALSELDLQRSEFYPKFSIEMSSAIREEDTLSNENNKIIRAYPSVSVKTPLGTQLKVYAEQSWQRDRYSSHNDQSMTMVVKQPLSKGVNPLVNRWPIKNAKIQYDMALLQFKQSVEEIIYAILISFMNYQQSHWQVELQQQYVQQTERFYLQLKEKHHAGRVSAHELIAPQLQIKQAKQSLLIANHDRANYRSQLFDHMGIMDEQQNIDTHVYVEPSIKNVTLDEVLENDFNLQRLKKDENRLKSELINVKDGQRFDLNLQADLHFGRSQHHTLENMTEYGYYHLLPKHTKGYAASLNLSIPLGEKQRYHQQCLVKHTDIQKNILEVRKRQQQLTHQYHDLLHEIDLRQAQQTLFEEETKLAQLEYENMLEKYWMGRVAIHEVMRAKERAHSTSLNAAKSKLALKASLIKLQKLAGNLLGVVNVSLN